jgi:hemolysin activation/secretion protein
LRLSALPARCRRRVVAGIACAHVALAAAQVTPDAGRIDEQLRAPQPPRVAPAPKIRIETPRAPSQKDTPPFYVARFRITGASAFRESELLQVLGEPRREMTLKEVQALAERLTDFYRDRGYIVARALIPAQDVRDGVVQILVLEGRYGRIDVANASEISETLLRRVLTEAGVKENELVQGPKLERAVLLVSDLAGIQPRATLEPGESTGLTNLSLEIAPTRAAEYDLLLDNGGNRFTGRGRLSAGVALNSPFDIGDKFTVRAITSGERLLSARLGYEVPVGSSGLRSIAYFSQTLYELGADFSALDASGTAQTFGGALAYPLVRSSVYNLRLQAGGEARELRDRIDALGLDNRKTAGVLLVGASADGRDRFLGGGLTSWQLLGSRGELTIHTDSLAASDAATARTAGGYAKVAYSIMRLQALTSSLRLSLSYSGQWAFDNLDSS